MYIDGQNIRVEKSVADLHRTVLDGRLTFSVQDSSFFGVGAPLPHGNPRFAAASGSVFKAEEKCTSSFHPNAGYYIIVMSSRDSKIENKMETLA